MLDVAVMNTYALFIDVHTEYMNDVNQKRRLFLKELVKELVMPHMAWCQKQPALKGHVKEATTKCGLIFSPMINLQVLVLCKNKTSVKFALLQKTAEMSSCCSKYQKPVCEDHSIAVMKEIIKLTQWDKR